jgi:hypothetical protein
MVFDFGRKLISYIKSMVIRTKNHLTQELCDIHGLLRNRASGQLPSFIPEAEEPGTRHFNNLQDAFFSGRGIKKIVIQLCAVEYRSRALLKAFGSLYAIKLASRSAELSKSVQHLPPSHPYSTEIPSATQLMHLWTQQVNIDNGLT